MADDTGTWWSPPSYKQDANWQDDDKWYREDFDPPQIRDVDFLLDFAQRQYEETGSNFESLDAKAEALIRFAGILTGAVFAVLRVVHVPVGFGGGLSLLLFLISVVLAMRVRAAHDVSIPTSVRLGLDSLDQATNDELKSLLAASYHCAISGTSIVNEWKAAQLNRAFGFFTLGLSFLTFDLLIRALRAAADLN